MEIRGIDFSGGRRPGADIWITEGRYVGGQLLIESCQSATERFDSTAREPLLAALRELLGAADGTTGLDFSFGLPAALLPERVQTLTETIEWFARTFDGDADDMRDRLKDQARALSVDGVELKRRTDRAVGANSPYSFITYYQTLYGIRDVLWPLVDEGAVRVPPADPPGQRNLIEIYPAGTLRRLGTASRKYKNDTPEAKSRRKQIVERLTDPEADGPNVKLSETDWQRSIDEHGGDALDSLVAAAATAWAAAREFDPESDFDEREGYIYV